MTNFASILIIVILFIVGFVSIWWYLPRMGTSRYLSHIKYLVLARPNDKHATNKAKLGGIIILTVGTIWFVVGALTLIAFLYDRALRLWG